MASKFTIDEWRRLRGYSQGYMAEKLDVHVNTYRTWEEKPSEIKIGKAYDIAEILAVSVADIIFLP